MKPTAKFGLATLLLPLLSSCRSNTPQTAATPPTTLAAAATSNQTSPHSTSETDSIYEALLRREVPAKAKICYVSFNGQDPSNEFVQRMREQKLPIEKMSLAPQPFKRGRGRTTKGPVIMILPLHWLTSAKVQVQCDWPGAGTRFTLERKNGAWQIVEHQMAWIS